MIQHHSPISGIAAFKDQYVATAGYDNQVILWNAKTTTAIAVGRHDHLVNQCEFSPCGRYLLSTSSDYSARLWLLPAMKLLSVLGPHDDDVETAVFHREYEWIATASRDKTVRLFDFQGHLLQRFSGHVRDVISVAWLNDETLLSSSDDGTIRKWHVATGEQLAVVDLGGVETDTVVIGREGIIFAGNDAGHISIINNDDIMHIPAHQAGIKRLCYSTQQNKLVSLSYDRSLILWDIDENNYLSKITSTHFPNCVWARSCAFLGSDKLVLATFGSCYATFNYKTNNWRYDAVKETHGINAVLLKTDILYSVGDAGIVSINQLPHIQLSGLCNFLVAFAGTIICGGQTGEIYDALTGDVIYQHHSPLNCGVAYSYDNKQYAIIGTYTGEGIVLSVNDAGKIDCLTTVSLHQNAIKGIATDNEMIFSVCADYNAAFHDVKSLRLVQLFKSSHDKIANACISLGHERFMSVSRDLKLRVFSLDYVKSFNTRHKHSIKCLAVSHNKEFIASADYNGHIYIYNKNMAVIAHYRPTTAGISSIIAGKTNHEFIASSYDGELYPLRFSMILEAAA